jgi:hypothetical protein
VRAWCGDAVCHLTALDVTGASLETSAGHEKSPILIGELGFCVTDELLDVFRGFSPMVRGGWVLTLYESTTCAIFAGMVRASNNAADFA